METVPSTTARAQQPAAIQNWYRGKAIHLLVVFRTSVPILVQMYWAVSLCAVTCPISPSQMGQCLSIESRAVPGPECSLSRSPNSSLVMLKWLSMRKRPTSNGASAGTAIALRLPRKGISCVTTSHSRTPKLQQALVSDRPLLSTCMHLCRLHQGHEGFAGVWECAVLKPSLMVGMSWSSMMSEWPIIVATEFFWLVHCCTSFQSASMLACKCLPGGRSSLPAAVQELHMQMFLYTDWLADLLSQLLLYNTDPEILHYLEHPSERSSVVSPQASPCQHLQ